MPEWSHWWIRLQIDDGPILKGTHIYFHSSDSPTIVQFYPQPSAPARSPTGNDYDNTFWTPWFDLDDNLDGDEDESLTNHMLHDPKLFQRCQSPLEISIVDKKTGKPILISKSQNADHKPVPGRVTK